jgi:hypothetical protein
MNTTLLNQTILCGQPKKGLEIAFVLTEMNEEEKRYAATLLNCRHSKEEVVDRFDKNAVITATSMNSLKNQIFQMLGIDDSKFRTTSWMKMMRINGKTIDKLCKQGPAPAEVSVEAEVSVTSPIVKPNPVGAVYLIKGPDFGYIGETMRDFKERMKEHKRACLDNLKGNFKTPNSMQILYTAINNNGGWANVKTSIIEYDIKSKKEARDREKYWIQYYEDNLPIYLLNMRSHTK